MKLFSLLEAPSQEAVEIGLKKIGRSLSEFKNTRFPQEDFLLVSKKYPIFVVADGVTLIQYILDKKQNEYPDPSPAGDVARIFCETLISAAEEKYNSFNERDIEEIFTIANEAVADYNRENGREKGTLDYWDMDLYAATTAFVVLKDNKAYWGSVCDSYITHFGREGSLRFMSPACHSLKQAKPPDFTGDNSDKKARAQYAWSTTRNGVNEKGERIGYGVVTGEPQARNYLCGGIIHLQDGDFICILTDGFEDYIKLPEFISLFSQWNENLESQVKAFTLSKSEEDPEKYGHERSIIVFRT